MSTLFFSTTDLQVIQDHFPDGVDIMLVPDRYITETAMDLGVWLMRSVMSDGAVPPIEEKHDLVLQEIEPEVGIYACMSPVTHRVYVYVGPEYGR